MNSDNPLKNRNLLHWVRISVWNCNANWESLTLQTQQMTPKPVPTSGRVQGDFIYRHHNEPRVQLFVSKEETFPNPLKYIDVTRSSRSDLDVMQEKRIDDYWNVDSSNHSSDTSLFWKWSFSKRIHVVQEKIDKDSNDYQTRSCMARSVNENL